MLATRHFVKALPELLGRAITDDWFASSYYIANQNNTFLGDNYGLWRDHRAQWLMDGREQIGDVRLRRTIEYHELRLREAGARINFVTSDLAMDADNFDHLEQVNVRAEFWGLCLGTLLSCNYP